MSSNNTPPEAHSNPKGSPALSTPPQALEDAGSPQHQASSSKPGSSSRLGSLPPLTRPNPQNPAHPLATPEQRGQLSRAALTSRYGGAPPHMPPPRSGAQSQAYDLPPIIANTKWSKWIGVFSWVTCAGVGTYMVLFMPLGDKETVFHPVRRKFFGIVDRLNGTYDESKVQAELAKARVDWEEMEVRQKRAAEMRRAQGVWGAGTNDK